MKTLIVTFLLPDGSPAANAKAELHLSASATVLGTGMIAPRLVSVQLDDNGSATIAIFFNDQLSPAGTSYRVRVLDATGNVLYGPESFTFAGASPLTLAELAPALKPQRGRLATYK